MSVEKKGKLIAFEGIDGSGKSTQIKLLAEKLKERQLDYYLTMEPTDSPIGSLIRQVLVGEMKTDNKVVAALFVADRLDHLLNKDNGIVKKINEGTIVLCDRYYFSSYAYNSIDMSMDWVIDANEPSRNILKPTATIFIDISPEVAMDRITKNRSHQELFEKKSRLEEVKKKYEEAFLRMKDSETIIVVDGNQSVEEIADDIWEKVQLIL
jgi:dTMP kinase